MKPVLVRDLALEEWPSMDRYATALSTRVAHAVMPNEWRMDGPRYLTRYWTYPRRLAAYRGDLVHVLDHSYAHCLRAFPGTPSVVTVHDLLPLRTLAEGSRGLRGAVRDRLLRWVLSWVQRADRLIVSTQFTEREVARYLDVPAGKIRVIPYGVDHRFFERPSAEACDARRRGWLEQCPRSAGEPSIILHVGSCHPRKNLEAAIAALGLLRRRGVHAVLVQIGGSWERAQLDALHAADVEGFVLQETRVAEDALLAAYCAADVLVMPSTFEGFGLPVLEAMAAGLPVVTSGAGGLREVVADAGIVTGTVGAEPLADELGRLLASPALRADLVQRGKARARGYSWDETARLTQAVYDELAGK